MSVLSPFNSRNFRAQQAICKCKSALIASEAYRPEHTQLEGELVQTVSGRDLAGQSDLLLRRNSQNGRIECLTNKSAVALNEALHAHN